MTRDLKESAAQTAGPYVHIGLTPNFSGIAGVYPRDLGAEMLSAKAKGERITITGRVFDGGGLVLKDALIEIWQADAEGKYNSDDFQGWGRCATDMDTGVYRFDTIKPGPVPHPSGSRQSPHITIWLVARGINLGLNTRLYFADEDNSQDPILGRIEHKERIKTLVAGRQGNIYTFDIHLQGENETVFFDI
jgi:protocatechuate 3,4-dioxygenase, alpha subunit